MLSLLSVAESSASTVLAVLRTLNTIADASALFQFDGKDRYQGLFHALYTDNTLGVIVQLLSQSSTSQFVQQQVSLAAALMAKTCRDESQRNLLVHVGILEALASKLAASVAATDRPLFVSRNASSKRSGMLSATMPSHLAPILGAIGSILDTSRTRALHLLSTPALTAALLRLEADVAFPHEKNANPGNNFASSPAGNRPSSSRRLDYLLPQIPCYSSKVTLSETSSHPPFGAIGTTARQQYAAKIQHNPHEPSLGQTLDSPQEEEKPFIVWLIYVVRASSGLTRLMAAWIISLFHCSGIIDKRRDSSFAMLLVPLLVRLLEEDSTSAQEAQQAYDANPLRYANLASQEQPGTILATLMVDSVDMQRAAVDAGAIKKLAQLLKESYNPIPTDCTPSQWTAEPSFEDGPDANDDGLRTGNLTKYTSRCQVAKVRESILLALASLASVRDDYRKAIIENGVVPFVIESLKPHNQSPSVEGNGNTPDPARHGSSFQIENPVGVILAACGTTRSLSRSVTTLRTSLMDAGVAAPLFVLLKHYDINVQVAATSVISNLVLEFSPMREVSGPMKIEDKDREPTDWLRQYLKLES